MTDRIQQALEKARSYDTFLTVNVPESIYRAALSVIEVTLRGFSCQALSPEECYCGVLPAALDAFADAVLGGHGPEVKDD